LLHTAAPPPQNRHVPGLFDATIDRRFARMVNLIIWWTRTILFGNPVYDHEIDIVPRALHRVSLTFSEYLLKNAFSLKGQPGAAISWGVM
jgi:hypothetical protein